jgi:hypothetical protein
LHRKHVGADPDDPVSYAMPSGHEERDGGSIPIWDHYCQEQIKNTGEE